MKSINDEINDIVEIYLEKIGVIFDKYKTDDFTKFSWWDKNSLEELDNDIFNVTRDYVITKGDFNV